MVKKLTKQKKPASSANERRRTDKELRFEAYVKGLKEQRRKEQKKEQTNPKTTDQPNPRRILTTNADGTRSLKDPGKQPEKEETIEPKHHPVPQEKKQTFEEKHNRYTTYIEKRNHKKLNKIKATYGKSKSHVINDALREYFIRHQY